MSQTEKFTLPQVGSRLHFIGVLGAGMLPLARLLISRGYIVSGSDTRSPEMPLPRELDFREGHSPDMLSGAEACVFSLAVPDDDPELCRAGELGIRCVSRPELLGAVVDSFPCSIAVAGSHGKSSVTAMLATILKGRRPTVLCGAGIGSDGFVLGSDELLVYEACEYRDAFLSTRPTLALLLNLELDHTDYFKDISSLESSFSRFAASAARVVYNADDPRLSKICRAESAVGFGRGEESDYRCRPLGQGRFHVYRRGELLGEAELSILGDFNIMNATAASAASLELGVPFEEIRSTLADYRGIPRRLQRLGALCGREVFYDYAHHPTEISAGIDALRAHCGGEITVVFRPHTYSRTASLASDFATALGRADRVILLDIFAARESAIDGVSSKALADRIGKKAIYAESQPRAADILLGEKTGAIVLMGAGDLSQIKEILKKNLDKAPTPC